MSPNPDAAEEELPFKEGQVIKVRAWPGGTGGKEAGEEVLPRPKVGAWPGGTGGGAGEGCPQTQVPSHGSPTLGPWTSMGLWPVGNWIAQQEVSGGVSKQSFIRCIAAPSLTLPLWSSISCQISGSIDSHRSTNPTVL